jgi:hypothetical protein
MGIKHAHNFKDLTGQKINRWKVIELVKCENHRTYWLCECECGTVRVVQRHQLINGHSKSCGCLAHENTSKRSTTHGFGNKKSPNYRLYKIWSDMRSRCNNPKCSNYKNYGGRGIAVWKEWASFINFANWALSNGYEPSLTIDRKDNNGNYEPSNCRWVTNRQNNLNRRNNHFITINGATKTLVEWAEISGLPISTLRNRLLRGWSESNLLNPAIRNQLKDCKGRFTSKSA